VAIGADSSLRDSRLSRAEALARSLEDEISAGTVSAGDWLGTKEDLRQRFNVAVATVNEAVKLLDARGMVEVRSGPGGGVFVAAPDARMRKGPLIMGFQWAEATVADYQEVRTALEPLICMHALHHHSGADIRALEQIVDKMEASLGDPAAYVRLNTAFHRRVAKMSRNAPLRSLYVTLLDFYEHAIKVERMDVPESVDPSNIAIHRQLVRAIASGDHQALAAAIERHDANRLAFGMLRRSPG
jgi:GntR family transcriptional repressor for pyruvate dehydrogenase complex